MSHTPALRGDYRTDQRTRQAYSEGAGIYRIVPAAVACPVDAEDVVELVGWARRHRQSLVPRGAGSAMGGGNVGDGIVVDLSNLTAPAGTLDAARRTITVGAGITLGQVDAVASPLGLRLPPDPSSRRWATAGGAFATNAAGPRSLRYGAMRPWIEAATIITGAGEALHLQRGSVPGGPAAHRFQGEVQPALERGADLISGRFPRTAKNSSGLALDAWLASRDLIDLFIGSEGILGIVTEVVFRLDRIPPSSASIRIELQSLEHLGATVQALLGTQPSTCELLDRTFLDLVRDFGEHGAPPGEGLLLVEYEGETTADVMARVARATALLQQLGLNATVGNTPESAAELWEVRHAASPILASLPPETRSLQVVEDGCVPVDRLADYVMLLRNAALSRGLRIVLFGHAGSGHLHANLLANVTQPGFEQALEEILGEVSAGVARLGGTLSGEHGDGRLRAPLLEGIYGTEVLDLFRAVKHCFDPDGILNPGVILPTSAAQVPLGHLKVGSNADALEPDVAAALRAIERNAGYATARLALADGPSDG
jgi:FAD/FMN-containing dehydrogenase